VRIARIGSQVLDVKIVNCGGLRDLMSEMESSFLVSALGLFRNHQDLGKGYPRANVNLVRAYKAEHFYRAAFGEFDVLHVIGHASGDQLDVGVAKRSVEASRLGVEERSLAPHCRRSSCRPIAGSRARRGKRD
jgi:hypothetical protein